MRPGLMRFPLALCFITVSALAHAQGVDQEESAALDAEAANNTPCGYQVSNDQRFELILKGFQVTDANHNGFNYFSRLNYVFPDELYVAPKNTPDERYRVVYLGEPAIHRSYVGKSFVCSEVLAFRVGGNPSELKRYAMTQVYFFETQ